jgi:hypothetical protein
MFFVICIRFLVKYIKDGNTAVIIINSAFMVSLVAATVYANIKKGTVRAWINGSSICIGGRRYDCGQIESVYGAPSRNVEIYSGGRRILKVGMKDDNYSTLVRWARRNGINTELGDMAPELKNSTKILLAVISIAVFVGQLAITIIYALSA